MFHSYVYLIWPVWLLYDVTERKRDDSVTIWNVERSFSRIPPPAECPSVHGATYRINLDLKTVVLHEFSEINCRKAIRIKHRARSQCLIGMWREMLVSELKHHIPIIIKQCPVAICSSVAIIKSMDFLGWLQKCPSINYDIAKEHDIIQARRWMSYN